MEIYIVTGHLDDETWQIEAVYLSKQSALQRVAKERKEGGYEPMDSETNSELVEWQIEDQVSLGDTLFICCDKTTGEIEGVCSEKSAYKLKIQQ